MFIPFFIQTIVANTFQLPCCRMRFKQQVNFECLENYLRKSTHHGRSKHFFGRALQGDNIQMKNDKFLLPKDASH